ncbi:MAG: hypothetical protein ACJ8C4_12805 [Gemmataceae bacterium]
MRLVVIDGNAPWVRSLFAGMPGEVAVDLLRVYSAVDYVRNHRGSMRQIFRWRQVDERTRELTVLVPGWTRAYAASSAIVQSAVRRVRRNPEAATSLVFTTPFYARVAKSFPGVNRSYFAYDPFLAYDWDATSVARLEKELLCECDSVFAISHALADDFSAHTSQPVHYLPNAVAESFLERLSNQREPMPEDLADLPRPIIGCVGQINRSYDWDLIATISDALPHMSFVFVGPIFLESAEMTKRIQSVLSRPNVRHLGTKPHEDLPRYLMHYDVCFNSLEVNEQNHRRSPLRLYDYLATDRPILSTAIREAYEHRPFIEIGPTADDCVNLLRTMTSPDYRTDLVGRAQYILRNTWQNRAEQMLQWILSNHE